MNCTKLNKEAQQNKANKHDILIDMDMERGVRGEAINNQLPSPPPPPLYCLVYMCVTRVFLFSKSTKNGGKGG
jgi:hypothetical protein